ncbi:electron transfer flavoprotein alpha subunit apoprotein [Desulfuromusa kysingii]|uniref:Electron transfer flavoprotein alpha subunit apoprotein n=1 Tax=Desulfuromusa kysingii TaxID=37625 RepID=A0A1H4C7C3_9BACT|nr:FAD-binding protein [Desulfuromusa kysingii]SEA56246.1 electron transfer flavoprotein alpha subunit apoprotein [Desulfuromusa kysingii]
MSYVNTFIIADTEMSIKELASGASNLSTQFSIIIFDEELKDLAASYGAKNVYVYRCDASTMIEDSAKMISEKLQSNNADLVLVNNSVRGKLLAGKLAVYLDTCVVSGISSLEDKTTQRMVYGGAAFRSEKLTSNTAVITSGAGVFEITDPAVSSVSDTHFVDVVPSNKIKKIETQAKQEIVSNLAIAKKVVDMGRGFKEEADVEMCRELATLLGADLGCSRPVAENNGWLPKAVYIGITGMMLKPELVISLATSGQVQHMVGINQAKTIVAINKDENSPIFKSCDLGLVGDVYEILPKLIAKLR